MAAAVSVTKYDATHPYPETFKKVRKKTDQTLTWYNKIEAGEKTIARVAAVAHAEFGADAVKRLQAARDKLRTSRPLEPLAQATDAQIQQASQAVIAKIALANGCCKDCTLQ
jgi:hypothetical protein